MAQFMNKVAVDLSIARDPRESPVYSISEAAHCLRLPQATLRSWVVGRYYLAGGKKKFFRPVIDLADKGRRLLSFMNLVDAHVLDAIRREPHISLAKVETALDYLEKRFPSKHPLADQKFETDGSNLFIQKYSQLINLSQEGQLAMRNVLEAHLCRIERDASGLAVRLYLFTGKREPEAPEVIVVDPYVSFGRPVLVGTGIATAVIAERFEAGESIEELADDYGCQPYEIEEALRCELQVEAA